MKRSSGTENSTKRPATQPAAAPIAGNPENDWFAGADYDGQLAVDVYQTPTEIIITSPIAGVAPEDLDIAVNGDVVTIRGRRRQEHVTEEHDYLFQECYWGGFSRSVILPVDVQADRVTAQLRSGILTVTLPKTQSTAVRIVPVSGE